MIEAVWMPHPGHFIGAKDCKFFLNTYINGYIVSTVGELLFDSRVRQILAYSRGISIEGRGDEWDRNYLEKIGYEDLGVDRKYETMVFKAKRRPKTDKNQCCPYFVTDWSNLDFNGYNDPTEARKGHMKMIKKWGKKSGSKAD